MNGKVRIRTNFRKNYSCTHEHITIASTATESHPPFFGQSRPKAQSRASFLQAPINGRTNLRKITGQGSVCPPFCEALRAKFSAHRELELDGQDEPDIETPNGTNKSRPARRQLSCLQDATRAGFRLSRRIGRDIGPAAKSVPRGL